MQQFVADVATAAHIVSRVNDMPSSRKGPEDESLGATVESKMSDAALDNILTSLIALSVRDPQTDDEDDITRSLNEFFAAARSWKDNPHNLPMMDLFLIIIKLAARRHAKCMASQIQRLLLLDDITGNSSSRDIFRYVDEEESQRALPESISEKRQIIFDTIIRSLVHIDTSRTGTSDANRNVSGRTKSMVLLNLMASTVKRNCDWSMFIPFFYRVGEIRASYGEAMDLLVNITGEAISSRDEDRLLEIIILARHILRRKQIPGISSSYDSHIKVYNTSILIYIY